MDSLELAHQGLGMRGVRQARHLEFDVRTVALDEEIELGEADCDTVFYDGAAIDLGTALADTLALNLDPYPRSAAADAELKEAGVLTEEQASPFAVLAKLMKSDEA